MCIYFRGILWNYTDNIFLDPFKYVSEKKTYHEAEEDCKQFGGHIYSPSNAQENTELVNNMKG